MNFGKLLQLTGAEAVVVTLMTTLIVVGYAWVIPRYFNGARTYSILIGGVAIGVTLSGVIAKKFCNKSEPGSWMAVAIAAIMVAIMIVLTTLGALTKIFGS